MGQNFVFFNIDKRQCWGGAKFGEMLPSGEATDLTVKLLKGIEIVLPDDPLKGHPHFQARKSDIQLTSLSDLPVELQSAIFEELEDPIDIFALCVSSIHFWMVGIRRFNALYIQDCLRENWAGDRIICLGDYADDLPDGMFTDAELKEYGFDHLESKDSLYRAFTRVFVHRSPPSRFDFGEMMDRLGMDAYDGDRLSFYETKLYPWMRRHTIRPNSKAVSPWVLRNLSKNVYVRADKLALEPEDIGPKPWMIKGMSFGSLVASRIAWSSDPSMAMSYSYDHDMHRGVWAGDRFDIVGIQQVEEGWIDVTAEAKKELEEIWKSEFGDNWEETVVESGL